MVGEFSRCSLRRPRRHVSAIASRVGIDSMRVTSVRSASHGLAVGVRRQKRFPLARRFLFMVGAVMGILLLMNVAYCNIVSARSDLDDLDENELLSWRKKRKSPPSPPPTPAENIIRGLQRLLDAKIITKEQFEKKKAKALTPPPPPRGPPPPPPSCSVSTVGTQKRSKSYNPYS